MSDSPEKSKPKLAAANPADKPVADPKAAKQARLAKALRDNLARRKAQAATKGGTGRFSRIEEEVSSPGAAQVIVLWVFEGAG